MRKQKAVWWARNDDPDRFGRYLFSAPVEIKCRWDDTGEEYVNPKGETVVSKSIVYPDQILGVGDMVREGEIDSDESTDPTTVDTASEIQRFDKVPNFKATETLYIAYL
jgi:hypothetical protein